MAARQGLVAFEAMEVRRLFATDLVSDAVGLHAAASIEVGGTSYFFADDGIHGRELWKSDGTPEGTVLVKDLTPGAAGSELHSFFHAGTRVVFVTVIANVDYDFTLWSSDGSAAGTIELAEFAGAEELPAVQVGERVAILHTHDGADAPQATDAHLYFTDGTVAGTSLVRTWRGVAPDPDGGGGAASYSANGIWASGERVVFHISSLWSSDGTAGGTIDLDPVLRNPETDVPYDAAAIFEANGTVYIPAPLARKMWETDGTPGGTVNQPFAVSGTLEHADYAHAGDLFYFVDVSSTGTGVGLRKTLWAYDVVDGMLAEVFRAPGDRASNVIRVIETGGPILFEFFDADGDDPRQLWTVQGADATKVMNVNQFAGLWNPVSLDGVAYFVLLSKTTYGNFEVDDGDDNAIGEMGSRVGGVDGASGSRVINTGARGGETAWLHLWRTDGTVAGTGIVRTIWEGDPGGKQILGSIAVATGKLLVRTEVSTGVRPGRGGANDPPLTKIWDDTLAYEPAELSIERDFATARMVNGVLRLNGSKAADTFRMYRPERDQSLLVVEVNGVARSFPYGSIRRIVADLQDGNDKYEVVEYPGAEIRLWTSILGGDGADTILTGTGRDTIVGGSGPDRIVSRGNADMIIAGGGRDRVTGGQGDDVISGGTGHDSIITSAGHDVLFGQNAVERTFGQLWEDGDEEEDLLLPALF